MKLLFYELKKILLNPLVLPLFGVMLLFNLYMDLWGSFVGVYAAGQPYDREFILQQQENGRHLAGEVNAAWAEKYRAEVEVLKNNPANLVDDAEKERRLRDYEAGGLPREEALQDNSFFLREDFMKSNLWNRYEPVNTIASFHEFAKRQGQETAGALRGRYPGEKGEALAQKAETLYSALAEDYTARYNYFLGYQRFRNVHAVSGISLGILVIVALAPLFSSESSRRTDALILTARYGKSRGIAFKIAAGLLFSLAAFLVIELFNAAVIFGFYGTQGAEAYWQDWIMTTAPFAFNQGQISLVVSLTSLLGLLFLSACVLLLSSVVRRPMTVTIAGLALLLLPIFGSAFTRYPAVGFLLKFMPVSLLSAVSEWQTFDAVYLMGFAVLTPCLVIAVTVFLTLALLFLSFLSFRRHQVKN